MPRARARTVSAVHDYGAGVSLEITRGGAPPLLVPFTRACVPEVDVAGRPTEVEPPPKSTLSRNYAS